MSDIAAKAGQLLRLHHTGRTLVPTVWDAWSARTVADAGFLRSASAATRSPTPAANRTTKA